MANLTLAEYIVLCKAFLNESRTDTQNPMFPDDSIIAALNAAQSEVCVRLAGTRDFFLKTASVNVTTGAIAVPTDYLVGLGATLVPSTTNTQDRRRLPILSSGQMDDQYPSWRGITATANPYAIVQTWGSSGATLTLYPQPTSTITNGLFLDYVVQPDEMTDDADTSPVMDCFSPHLQRTILPYGALREMALYEAGESDDQFQKYDALFDKGISRLHEFLNSAFKVQLRYGSGWQ